MLRKPFTDQRNYVSYFRSQNIPVLRKTAQTLAAQKADEDKISTRQIAAVVLDDPLMALKLMMHLQRSRGGQKDHQITTIERAVMMLGVTPFFRHFSNLTTVEEQLAAYPNALVHALRAITRARRAAGYARDFALMRHDIDVDEITLAALLHEVAEILCWCFAPELSQQTLVLQNKHPGTRSALVQKITFNISFSELQFILAQELALPKLLAALLDPADAEQPRVRTVALATDLARHAANGWDDPALPDDFRKLSELFHLNPAALMQRIGLHGDVIRRLLPRIIDTPPDPDPVPEPN
ncbi:MAG: HDOD domain-containing protein [Betaproteobacteria bacterium]|nr:HDOD domain-containing protein [Betaproteobacteria bacterium]